MAVFGSSAGLFGEYTMAIFGSSAGKTPSNSTNKVYSEKRITGSVFKPELLNVKVPGTQQGKATQTREGGVSKPRMEK